MPADAAAVERQSTAPGLPGDRAACDNLADSAGSGSQATKVGSVAEPFIGQAAGEATAEPKPIAGMSFEEAMAELEGIVQRLERGQLDLESSIAAYERGTALRQHCQEMLRQAQLRVDKLTFDAAGRPRTTPFDAPA